jgi:hypothetical protein
MMDHISMQLYAKERIASARAEADLHRELRRVREEKENQREPSSKAVGGIAWILELATGLLRQVLIARQSNKENTLPEFTTEREVRGAGKLTSEELPG